MSADLGPLASVLDEPGAPTRPTAPRRPSSVELSCGRPRSCPGRRRSRCSSSVRSRTTRTRCVGPTTRRVGSTARRPTERRWRSCRAVEPAPAAGPGWSPEPPRRRPSPSQDAASADDRRRPRRSRRSRPSRHRGGRRRAAAASTRRRAPPHARTAPDAPAPVDRCRHAADGAVPQLYDGDIDRTKDELARRWPSPSRLADRRATPGRGRRRDRRPRLPAAVTPAPTLVGARRVAPATRERLVRRPLERWTAASPAPRWPWLVASLIVALAGLGFLAYSLFQVPTHPVPELVGLDEQAARAQTADFNWDIESQHARSDEHPDPGEIIRTAPSAGEHLAEDEPFLIVVSDGPEFRTLPDLTGLTQAAAETPARRAPVDRCRAGPAERRERRRRLGDLVVGAVGPDADAGGQVAARAPRSSSSCPPARRPARSPRSSGSPSTRRPPRWRPSSSASPSPSPCSATTSRPAAWCRPTPPDGTGGIAGAPWRSRHRRASTSS